METHAPGVFGLPGGYPVRFKDGEIQMDLPSGLSQAAAVQFNIESAVLEGIERIDECGTLFYTKQAQDAVASWCPELAEPLVIGDAPKRFEVLKRMLNVSA